MLPAQVSSSMQMLQVPFAWESAPVACKTYHLTDCAYDAQVSLTTSLTRDGY